mmetsp:Transcript_61384/g.68744  ORF Transcript_61384/g.68744 Transcript_61384/m.68744 type:complete len:161 (+) Transcript_61384:158-640(+)
MSTTSNSVVHPPISGGYGDVAAENRNSNKRKHKYEHEHELSPAAPTSKTTVSVSTAAATATATTNNNDDDDVTRKVTPTFAGASSTTSTSTSKAKAKATTKDNIMMSSKNSSKENQRGKYFVDKIKDHLLCSICFGVFKRPVVLACCGQTLCEECLLSSM